MLRIMPKKVVRTLLFASLLAPVGFAADPERGNPVTISGCLHGGKHSDQFVLSDVTNSQGTEAIYWLDSMSQMQPYIGQRVDVSAVVVKRDSSNGSIKVTVMPDSEIKMNVRGPNDRGITTKYPGTGNEESTGRIPLPVYKVHVQSVAPLGPGEACR